MPSAIMLSRSAICRRLSRTLTLQVHMRGGQPVVVASQKDSSKHVFAFNLAACKPASCTYSSSALYINRGDTSSVVTVDLDLDLKDYFGDIQKLETNVKARKMESKIDVHKLLELYQHFQDIESEKSELEAERETVSQRMRVLVKERSTTAEEKKKYLISRGKKIKEDLKKLQKIWWTLEEEVTLETLKLPVALHPSTGPEDTVVKTQGQKPVFDFAVRSHAELGQQMKVIQFSPISPGAYYLHGDLALLELHLVEKMRNILESHGFTPFSCPDVVKTLIMEACGKDFNNKDQVFTLQAKATDIEANLRRAESEGKAGVLDKWDITLHLCGGASPCSFVAYLTRMNISTSDLPLKWFSTGRHYAPNDATEGSVNLLNTSQSTRVEMFGAAQDSVEADALYQQYCELMWNVYTQFDLPIRLVHVGAPNLQHMEASRTEAQVWLPSRQQYIPISSVCLWADFVSRRLMIKHDKDHNNVFNTNHVHMVHGTLLNVPHLLAAIMENHQTKDEEHGFRIPATLQYMQVEDR